MPITTITRSADFLATLGVDTHVPYTDGGYANVGNIAADLAYLGINHVRDGISDGQYGSASLSSYIKLAQKGVTFTIVAIDGSVTDTASLNARLALIKRLVTAVPGSVTAIEGANEVNNWPVTFNGVGGLQGAVDLQKALYAAVHGDPTLQGIAVDYFTGYAAGGVGNGPDPSTTPGLADFNTQHPYPQFGAAPASWVDPLNTTPNDADHTGPLVYTETGYSSNAGIWAGVSEIVQAKYTLDLLFDAAKDGVAQTDLYELMDAYAKGSPQGNDGWGLFAYGNTAKPVATALHNLTAILADTGTAASSFAVTATAPKVTGLPATGGEMVLQKCDGHTEVVLWAEPKIWNPATGTEIAAPITPVTLDLGARYTTVSVYDPLVGTSAIRTLTGANSLQVALTDHPLIVELGALVPAPTLTLTAQVLARDTGASATDGITSDGRVTLGGTVTGEAGTVIHVTEGTLDRGSATVAGDGTWQWSGTLGEGTHTLAATATDPDGRTATASAARAITVLTTPPLLTTDTETWSPTDKMETLTGTVSGAPGTTVTISDAGTILGSATIDGKGNWSFSKTFGPGNYNLDATATDIAGNTVTIDPPFTIADSATTLQVLSASLVAGSANLAINGGAGLGTVSLGAVVALDDTLTYDGSFAQTGAATLDLGSKKLTLTGTASFAAASDGTPTVTGASGSQLLTSGTTAVTGLTVGGSLLWKNTGMLTQTGTLTLGDGSDGGAQINNATGASWVLVGNAGIAAGSTTALFNDNGGKLVKNGGTTTTSLVRVDITNLKTIQGVVRVGSGTLELAGTLSGNLALKADAGTTLILDKSVGSGAAALYNGAGATLQLNDAQDYHGTIAGFAGGQTLDLRSIAFSGSNVPGYSGNTSAGTLTLSDGTHAASLSMLGSYAAASFHAASDGHGGTAITFVAPA